MVKRKKTLRPRHYFSPKRSMAVDRLLTNLLERYEAVKFLKKNHGLLLHDADQLIREAIGETEYKISLLY